MPVAVLLPGKQLWQNMMLEGFWMGGFSSKSIMQRLQQQ
jgi:hypothetical protein